MNDFGKLFAASLLAGTVLCAGSPSVAADFGRGERGVMQDRVLPVLGGFVARFRGEPVSYFNLTDEEKILRQQVRHLVGPPHARDWLHAVAERVQRYRVSAPLDPYLSTDAYYAYLRSDRFRSTAGRYNRVSADIAADAALIPPFFARARQVAAADVLRLEAAELYGPGEPNRLALQSPLVRPMTSMQKAAHARVFENQELIDWARRAVAFRVESYRNAIERLAIEEPDARLGLVDGELQRLEYIVRKATVASSAPDHDGAGVRRSRYITGGQSVDPYDQPVPQK
jgi:hypothetical protein